MKQQSIKQDQIKTQPSMKVKRFPVKSISVMTPTVEYPDIDSD